MAIVSWSVLGLVAVLLQAIVRLLPRALEPVLDGSLDVVGVLAYLAAILGLGYAEGYRGFQRSFSPRVVVRALVLAKRPADQGGWLVVIGPLMVMGLVHATRRRLLGSWALVLGIVGVIMLVSLLEHPWRGAVDAGVVVGLSWGVVATVGLTIRALRGEVLDADAALPRERRERPSAPRTCSPGDAIARR